MKLFSIISGIVAGFLFGIATPLSKLALSALNSFQLAGLLYLGAAAAFLPYILKNRKKEIKLFKQNKNLKYLIGIILSGGLLGPLFLMLGLKNADSMSVSVWLNMELAATAVLGVLFFKEHLGKFGVIGMLLTLAAGIVISYQEDTSGLISALFIIAACIFWGIDNQLTSIIDGMTPQATTFVKGIFGGTVNLIIGMIISGWNIQLFYIISALLIGIISYGISIYLYITSAQNLGAVRSQILFSTSPFWGIITAAAILGEPVTITAAAAVLLLIAGIVFSNMSFHNHRHIHKAMTHIHLHSHDDNHKDHFHPDNSGTEKMHSHSHRHRDVEHSHEHYPDMHHRHNHEKD